VPHLRDQRELRWESRISYRPWRFVGKSKTTLSHPSSLALARVGHPGIGLGYLGGVMRTGAAVPDL
jgi:hypothetical protein